MKKSKALNKPQETTFECYERQVIMHCTFKNVYDQPNHIGLREGTKLVCPLTDHVSHLAYVEGICRRPAFDMIQSGQSLNFVLIFEGLPKDCLYFHLIEPKIQGFEPFTLNSISRNKRDVYTITLQ